MFDVQVDNLCVSVTNITNGMVLVKLMLEGELETVAWLESQQHQAGVTRL